MATILNYQSWMKLFEEASSVQADPAKPADNANSVVYVSASSSASNVAPALAQKMGVKPNTLYTIKLPSLFKLRSIYLDGKFGGEKANADFVRLDPTTAATKPGEDILEINGKRITESGAIILTKAELANPQIVIKASNNGLLTLIRMGEAFEVMYTTHKVTLGFAKDFALRFAIGGNVAEKDSRGFSYWFARPGENSGSANTIATVAGMAFLKAAGHEGKIAVTDSVFGDLYNNSVKDKTPAESLASVAASMAEKVKSRQMLVQSPPADLSKAWNITNYSALIKTTSPKVVLRDEGLTALALIVSEVAKAIAPITPPPGFGEESKGVLASYAEMIQSSLTRKKATIATWFERLQSTADWDKTKPVPGATGIASANQKEGQFGPKN